MKKKIISMIILTLFCVNLNLFSDVKGKENINDLDTDTDYIPITFNNFENFEKREGFASIESTNYGSNISFNLIDIGYDTHVWKHEKYVLTFDSYGDCEYFDISLKFNYSVNSVDSFATFYMRAGSYYNYLGNYVGVDYISNFQQINYGAIYDAWVDYGEHSIGAYIEGFNSEYHTANNVPLECSRTVRLVRNETGLFSLIYNTLSEGLIIGHEWISDTTKPLNFIMLDFSYYFWNYIGSSIVAYDFNATLMFNENDVDMSVNINNPNNETSFDYSFGNEIFTCLTEATGLFPETVYSYDHIWYFDGVEIEEQNNTEITTIVGVLSLNFELVINIDSFEVGNHNTTFFIVIYFSTECYEKSETITWIRNEEIFPEPTPTGTPTPTEPTGIGLIVIIPMFVVTITLVILRRKERTNKMRNKT